MSLTSSIQWCRSTVNPGVEGGGCEFCPAADMVMRAIDEAVRAVVPEVFADPKLRVADPKFLLSSLVGLHCGNGAVGACEVLTSQILEVREVFALQIEKIHGREAGAAALDAIETLIVCCAKTDRAIKSECSTELRIHESPRNIHMFKHEEAVGGATSRTPRKKKLRQDEAEDFKRLHGLVSKHAKSLIEVSKALREIRERKLYRAHHATFEDYCQEAHGFSRQHVNHLIRAGNTLAEMETIVSTAGAPLPSNESQLRELARVQDVEERCRHYLELCEKAKQAGGEVTARRIREHLDGLAKGNDAGQESAPLTPKQRMKEALVVLGELEFEIGGDAKAVELLARLKKLLGD